MAITSTQADSDGIVYRTSGSFLTDATAADVTLTLGFTPRYIVWENVTDRIKYEWFEGTTNGTTIKTAAAGTRTLDTADVAISVNGGVVTITAAVAIQNKQCRWIATA
jgi:hypothetical protein